CAKRRSGVWVGEPIGGPAEMWATFQEPTLIRHGFAVPPSPLEGEGLRAVRCAAPTAGDGPGALVRKRQAQKWNRTSPNFFCSGPQWGRTGPHPSTPNFARRKDSACSKG